MTLEEEVLALRAENALREQVTVLRITCHVATLRVALGYAPHRENREKTTMNRGRAGEMVLAVLTLIFLLGACLAVLLVPNVSDAIQSAGAAPRIQTLSFMARYGVAAAATLLGIPLLLGIAVLAGALAHARRDSTLGQNMLLLSATLLLLASIGLTPFAGPYFFPAAITAIATAFTVTRVDGVTDRHASLIG